MSLDVTAVGYKTEPYDFKYDWKVVVLYALGVGTTREELPYLYERRGPRVLPSFAVVPAYPALTLLLERSGADLAQVVHGGQSIRLHRPIPPEGTLTTVGELSGIYDLKRLAQVTFTTQSHFRGELVCETEWSILVRDGGNFGGPRPPKARAPKAPADQAPAWSHCQMTSPEQALLYRLSGDFNPLHADPEVARKVGFEQGPILHGLCTFGFLARAVIARACGGDGDRLKSLTAQFRKPIWPGEALRTEGYALADGTLALEAFAADRPEAVVTGAWAETF